MWCFSFPKIAEIKDNYTKDLQAPSKLLAKEKKREEKNKSKKREEKKEPVGELLIPDWINFLTWEDFTKMRQSIKKPLTKIAITRILNKLEKFKNQGMNVEDILSESIENSWAGVFAIKGFKPNKGSVNNKDFGDNNDKW